jgi:CPA2 family monovalent cation:H+ antiporter-2
LIEIVALKIGEGSVLSGKTPMESQLRSVYGLTLVALKRNEKIIKHPSSQTIFLEGDIAYIVGKSEQITNAKELFSKVPG